MSLRSTPSLRWRVYGGMAVLMAGGMLAGFWPLISADRQLQAFCAGLAQGTPQASVQALAAEQGYSAAAASSGATSASSGAAATVVVDDPRAGGRRQCALPLDAQGRLSHPA